MSDHSAEPKAFFISPDGNIYPDTLICSGILPAELGGQPCPYSQAGRIAPPLPLNANDPNYSIDKGQPSDLCPPCAKQQLAHLGHWQGHGKRQFPEELLSLRLFKCRQWFWFVVPGLHDCDPTRICLNGETSEDKRQTEIEIAIELPTSREHFALLDLEQIPDGLMGLILRLRGGHSEQSAA